jgi:hypothetical protein
VKREAGVPAEVFDVPVGPGQQVVQHDDLVAFGEQPVGQVGPQKSRAPRDDVSAHETDSFLRLGDKEKILIVFTAGIQ